MRNRKADPRTDREKFFVRHVSTMLTV
jgi:hypothetical protein